MLYWGTLFRQAGSTRLQIWIGRDYPMRMLPGISLPPRVRDEHQGTHARFPWLPLKVGL